MTDREKWLTVLFVVLLVLAVLATLWISELVRSTGCEEIIRRSGVTALVPVGAHS